MTQQQDMHLSLTYQNILTLLQNKQLIAHTNIQPTQQQKVYYLSYSSKDIYDHTLFFCKGDFREAYLHEALDKGAQIYISEIDYTKDQPDIDKIIVTDVQKALALLSAAYYHHPEEQLTLIAITGTKGKTSTNYFIHHLLKKAYPEQVAFLSTYQSQLSPDPKDIFESSLTTPESLDLMRYLYTAVTHNMKYMVLEISSQAYKKNRVYGLTFDIGIFLNIDIDHIGPKEHPNFEDYFSCKQQLMHHSKHVIIHTSDPRLSKLATVLKQENPTLKMTTFAEKHTQLADIYYQVTPKGSQQTQVSLSTSNPEYIQLDGTFTLPMPGDFNAVNATAALITAQQLNVPEIYWQQGLLETHIPGRMHYIHTPKEQDIYIDYAHNALSLKAVTDYIQKTHPHQKLVIVAGSTGNKAQSRRKDFGLAINAAADIAYLTSDDPNFEDPRDIAQEIKHYITNPNCRVIIEPDRTKAIQMALNEHPEAVIFLAGKGADNYLTFNGVKTPYIGDAAVVQNWIYTLN